MPDTINERDWDRLLGRIKEGKCTPFLGAGACVGYLPLGADIAKNWASDYQYPFGDSSTDLARVAQFLAIDQDGMFPKESLIKKFNKEIKQPDFNDPNEPHGLLADFRLPVYITTNYDNFMIKALRSRKCEPIQESCRWNSILRKKDSVFDDRNFKPSDIHPVVYHLHGYLEEPESLVLTEDDYLDFLVNISKDADIIPSIIQESLAKTSLLFIGYKLADINFRVLLRGIIGYLEKSLTRSHISVQLVPVDDTVSQEGKDKAQAYLDKYFQKIDIKVFWGKSNEFTKELRSRWEKFI
ncbi:MAG: SIR2 family NAD-dependent protein deacylase [Ignavibacteria bacterium]